MLSSFIIEQLHQKPYYFFIFLTFWTIAWVATKHLKKNDKNHFAENGPLLTFNHVFGMILSSISLYYNDHESTFNESIVIFWFTSYFIIDLFDCLYRKDITFTIHALLSIGLCYINSMEKYYGLRTASLGSFTELSSPFLWKWKQSKKKLDFVIFAIVFFGCRLVWVPVFMYSAYERLHGEMDGFVIYTTLAFYGLQLVFFYKIVKLLVNYRNDNDDEGKKTKKQE